MDFFGLVDVLRNYCTTKEWQFIYGSDAFANALSGNQKYLPGDLILIADFTAAPTFLNGKTIECAYSGVMSLGRKCEINTKSNLDETPIQKYDLRLKELSQLLALTIGDIACANELDISNVLFKLDLNKFDLNADFVAASLTFTQ